MPVPYEKYRKPKNEKSLSYAEIVKTSNLTEQQKKDVLKRYRLAKNNLSGYDLVGLG